MLFRATTTSEEFAQFAGALQEGRVGLVRLKNLYRGSVNDLNKFIS